MSDVKGKSYLLKTLKRNFDPEFTQRMDIRVSPVTL